MPNMVNHTLYHVSIVDTIHQDHRATYSAASLACVSDSWIIKDISLVELASKLTKFIGDGAIYQGINNNLYVVRMGSTVVSLQPNISDRSTDKSKEFVLPVRITGELENVEVVTKYLDENYSRNTKKSIANWWYIRPDGVTTCSEIMVPAPPLTVGEFYPWLPNFQEFFSGFIASQSQLLFVGGPPGTGKTSLLRSAIYNSGLRASIAYDERLFERDDMFINFMTGGNDVLVVEDADLMLSSREHNGNKLVARFLNVSDGLIRFPHKKIVFTTNLRDFSSIDEALVRPGRCYGFIQARELTFKEAQHVCAISKLPIVTEDRDYSLAELLNNQSASVPKRSFGFIDAA